MTTLLGSVAAYTVIVVLLTAAVGHLASPGRLFRAVVAQGEISSPVLATVAVIVTETGLAVTGIIAVSVESAGSLRHLVLITSAMLFANYSGYIWRVRRARPDAPCGCSRHDLPITGWVVIRSAVLAGIAFLGAVLSDPVLTLNQPGLSLAVVLLAAATFSVLLWHLPAAMHIPPTAAPHRAGHPHLAHTGKGTA